MENYYGLMHAWMRACVAVAEGAAVLFVPAHEQDDRAVVAAALGDALYRVAATGGRVDVPRSLGTVYSGSIARFLGAHDEQWRAREFTREVNYAMGGGYIPLCMYLHFPCTSPLQRWKTFRICTAFEQLYLYDYSEGYTDAELAERTAIWNGLCAVLLRDFGVAPRGIHCCLAKGSPGARVLATADEFYDFFRLYARQVGVHAYAHIIP
jgi:hypothetical protein